MELISVGKYFTVTTTFYFGFTRVEDSRLVVSRNIISGSVRHKAKVVFEPLSGNDFATFSWVQNFLAIGLGNNTWNWNLVRQNIAQSRTIAVFFPHNFASKIPAQFSFFVSVPHQKASICSILTIGFISYTCVTKIKLLLSFEFLSFLIIIKPIFRPTLLFNSNPSKPKGET